MQPLFICFTQNLNYAIGWMVIHSLWQATAIAIISGIVALVVRKKSPQLRYWIHNTALLGVLIAAVLTFCLYYDFSKEIGQTIFIPENLEAATNAPAFVSNNQSTITNNPSEAPLSMEGLRMYFNRNIYLIVTIWVMGVALFILKLLGGISYVYYLRSRLNFPADEYWLDMVETLGEKAGVKRGMELVESALVRSPLVVGHLKPMILFPIGAINKLNTQEVEAILAHEIAHVLRNDYIFNIIQSVIEALFYFHPAVWWISANIRTERENSCDDVAIALCGNSMTYAKALVSVQEIAHFGSPQMAMAFAGHRKNQLLFRVQRILKQPHNKTNVMEKLIATCLLLVMMVALSFGGNSWNSNFNAEIKALNDMSTLVENNNNPENMPFDVFETKDYLKFKVKGILDSFPVGKEVTDGDYNYADNMFQAKLTVKEHAMVSLIINGSEIKANEIQNHVKFINKIIMRSSASPQYNDDNQPVPMPYPLAQQMPIFNESDDNMIVDNPDGSQTIISHPKNEGNIVQRVTTRQRDGSRSVSTMNNSGITTNETFDRNGKRITYTTTGAYGNTTTNQGNGKTYVNGNSVTTYDNNGTKSIMSYDNDGGKIVRIYKNENQLIHTIKLVNGRLQLDGRTVSDSDIRPLGWGLTSKGLQKIGGYQNLQPDAQSSWGNGASVNRNDQFDDLKEEMNDLKEEIADCECQSNTDFRKKLSAQIDKILADLNKGMSESEAKTAFKSIKKTWEHGECDDNNSYSYNNSNNNFGNGWSTTGDWRNVIQSELFKDGYVKIGESIGLVLTPNELVFNDHAFKNDNVHRKYLSLYERSTRKNLNGTVTMNFVVPNKNYNTNSKINTNRSSNSNNNGGDNEEEAVQAFFKDLVSKGYVRMNTQTNVAFNDRSLVADGKKIDNANFEHIKKDFVRRSGSKGHFSIAFNGYLGGSSDSRLTMNGSLATSINDK